MLFYCQQGENIFHKKIAAYDFDILREARAAWRDPATSSANPALLSGEPMIALNLRCQQEPQELSQLNTKPAEQ